MLIIIIKSGNQKNRKPLVYSFVHCNIILNCLGEYQKQSLNVQTCVFENGYERVKSDNAVL